jgi:hypothetical protein
MSSNIFAIERRDFAYYRNIMAKGRKKRGRPATGHDPVVPVRLPRKLLSDIDAWAAVYRNEYELVGMTRSAAIRCLILLGMERVSYRAVDPKDQTSFEGPTPPLLKFFGRGKIRKWLDESTGKKAMMKPAVNSGPGKHVVPTKAEVQAVADRYIARRKGS